MPARVVRANLRGLCSQKIGQGQPPSFVSRRDCVSVPASPRAIVAFGEEVVLDDLSVLSPTAHRVSRRHLGARVVSGLTGARGGRAGGWRVAVVAMMVGAGLAVSGPA